MSTEYEFCLKKVDNSKSIDELKTVEKSISNLWNNGFFYLEQLLHLDEICAAKHLKLIEDK